MNAAAAARMAQPFRRMVFGSFDPQMIIFFDKSGGSSPVGGPAVVSVSSYLPFPVPPLDPLPLPEPLSPPEPLISSPLLLFVPPPLPEPPLPLPPEPDPDFELGWLNAPVSVVDAM